MSVTVVAAVPRLAVVEIDGISHKIDRIENSNPEPGKITWQAEDGAIFVFGAAEEVEVLEFPKRRETSDQVNRSNRNT